MAQKKKALQRFRQTLEDGGWLDFIRRAVGALAVTAEPHDDGGFDIVIRWPKKTKVQEFNPFDVARKPCDYARSIVREIMHNQGVL